MSLDAINPFLYGYYPPHSSNDQKRAKKLHHALKKTDPALSQLFYQALSLSTKRQLEQICWQLTKETIPRSPKGFSDQLQEFCETPYTIFLQILLQSLDIAKAQHATHEQLKSHSIRPLSRQIHLEIVRWIHPWDRRALALTCRYWHRCVRQVTREEAKPIAIALSQELKLLKTKTLPHRFFSGVRISLNKHLSIAQLCRFQTLQLERIIVCIAEKSHKDILPIDSIYKKNKEHFQFLRPLFKVVQKAITIPGVFAFPPSFFKTLQHCDCLNPWVDRICSLKYIHSISALCQISLHPTHVDQLLQMIVQLNNFHQLEMFLNLLRNNQIGNAHQIDHIVRRLPHYDDYRENKNTLFASLVQHPKLSSAQFEFLVTQIHDFMRTELSQTKKNTLYLQRFITIEKLCHSPLLTFHQIDQIFKNLFEWKQLYRLFPFTFRLPNALEIFDFIATFSGQKKTSSQWFNSIHWISGCGAYGCFTVPGVSRAMDLTIYSRKDFLQIYWFLHRKLLDALTCNRFILQEWTRPFRQDFIVNGQWALHNYLQEEKRRFSHLSLKVSHESYSSSSSSS